jgi:hypothetical protein
MENNIIKFKATSQHVWEVRERPVPASSVFPEWWKDMPTYTNNENKFRLDGYPNVTGKKCFPMLDSISAGYIVTLWSDILVSENSHPDSKAKIEWTVDEPVADAWSSSQVEGFDFPKDCSKMVFKYMHGWIIKTPPGWSCLITHPVGYNNLPIQTITGLVDTDILDTPANSPFMIKSGFEGIIEKGTPMFQIIPFKRSDWKAEYELQKENENWINIEKLKTKMVSSYGRNLRKSKKYL